MPLQGKPYDRMEVNTIRMDPGVRLLQIKPHTKAMVP